MIGSNKKQQIFYIHGGSAYSDHDKFMQALQTKEIRDLPWSETLKKWPSTLRENLGDEYEVFMPVMPNSQNAKYSEWKIWFERHFEYLHDDIILIGWSQGGYFFTKYLIENDLPVTVKALFLVAAPCGYLNNEGEDGADFSFNADQVGKLAKKVNKITILHSKDDFVVSHEHALRYKEQLPEAELVLFEDKNHFLLEEFPELLSKVRLR